MDRNEEVYLALKRVSLIDFLDQLDASDRTFLRVLAIVHTGARNSHDVYRYNDRLFQLTTSSRFQLQLKKSGWQLDDLLVAIYNIDSQ